MAIVAMTKLRLIGSKADEDKVMDVLTKSHMFEPAPTSAVDGTARTADTSHIDRLLGEQAKLAFAIKMLDDANITAARIVKKAKKAKTDPGIDYVPTRGGGRKMITYADFYDCSAKEYELMAVCDRLEKLSMKKSEILSERGKAENKIKALLPYAGMPLAFSAAGETRSCTVMMAAAVERSADPQAALSKFTLCYEKFASPTGTSVAVVCLTPDAAAVRSALSESGFTVCGFDYDATAGELINEAHEQVERLDEESDRIFRDVLGYEKYSLELRTLYDVLGTEVEKSRAEHEFMRTDSTYVLEGWLPKEHAEEIVDEIKAKTSGVVVYLNDPTDADDPPVLLDNPKLIKPFEGITEMYSPPSYREKDPNPLMAVFFFIIFGMMMADAGYGLVLSLACTLLIKLTHFEKGVKNLAAVFGICGVSTVIWGALFGSWFGLDFIPPLWFNPLDAEKNGPIMLLACSVILGIIQLLTGYGVQAYYLFKKHKPFDAICDVGFIYLLFIGIAMIALPMVVDLPDVVGDIGLYVVIASLVLIFLTAGRHKKGILGKVGGGVSGLYGLVNLFSDILSYARIFGIALAGGAIASAFNTILGVLAGSVVGLIIAIPLGVVLHLFNLAISLLGAYVHNARLQFLEFYGKFYTGDGRLFAPLGESTKFVRFG